MTKKTGRPKIPTEERLGRIFAARLRKDQERDVVRAITSSGQSHAAWIRQALIDAAKKEQIMDSLRQKNE